MNDEAMRDPSERRRRALMGAVLILVMAGFAAVDALASHDGAWRSIDVVRVGAILLLALVVAVRSTTSWWFGPRVAALDDELTLANRASAAAWGYWALFAALIAAFAGSFFFPLRVAEIAPAVLVTGAAASGLRFVWLERQGE
ncbi:MAG: hypothetical protein AB7Q23_14670 [Hyphomonadaceae bacterium]